MKFLFFIIWGIILILTGVFIFYKKPSPVENKVEPQFVDYSTYVADISVENPTQRRIGYACVYAVKGDLLQLLTAEHIVSDKNLKYIITFRNGTSVKVANINKPVKNADLAILEVPKEKLKDGKEYLIPEFRKLQKSDAGLSLYAFGDEMDNYPYRAVDSVNERANISEVYFAGSISKGRSGSPVFIKGSNRCIGIISGFFTKDSGVGEKTVVLLH